MPSAPLEKAYASIGFALLGPPMLQGVQHGLQPFQKTEYRTTAAYRNAVLALADEYKTRVAASFGRRHGVSGKTEKSVSIKANIPASSEYAVVAAVQFEGNIGFVTKPLPPHVIPGSGKSMGKTFGNESPDHPAVHRATNFHNPFGPVRGYIAWFQGGDDSYSPDPEFWREEQPWLDVEAAKAMNKLAAVNKVLLQEDLQGEVVLAQGGFKIQ